ncbi:MAG: acyl-CoA thioesterase [Euryarchaeota archaeon]|nr:acyl-CoA thioesterase [Euryarchaeota archaeon]
MAEAREETVVPEGTAPFTTDVEVRFADVDGMRHVNNAKYLTYTEVCRTRFLAAHKALKDLDDMPFILARAEIDFRGAATMGDTVRVEMWVPRIGDKSWDFAYRMSDAKDGRLFAVARTVQVGYDYADETTIPVPERYLPGLLAIATPEVLRSRPA